MTNTRPIRIAHILTNLHDGGIEQVVLQLALGLPKEKFDVRVYALIDDNPWLQHFRDLGVSVTVIGAKNRLTPKALLPNLLAINRLANALIQDRIDIANTHDFFPAVLGRLAALWAGTPKIVTTLHNTYSWFGPIHHAINRLLACWTDKVVAVSQASLCYSQQHDKLPKSKYVLIPNGIDPNRFKVPPSTRIEVRQELGIAEHTFVIGNVGTHSVRKDQKTLLEAARILSSTFQDFHIIIVGSSRSHEMAIHTELLRLSNTTELKGKVTFLENRKDMERLYACFDIFCMPSIAEGLSLASMEAMMAGCLPVYSNIPPLMEVVTHGETGFTFPVGDAQGLVEVFQYLRNNANVLQKYKENARNHALANFSQIHTLVNYSSLYLKISQQSNVEIL